MANILIGISGSIAAYKTVLLVRNLTKNGHNCKVIITRGGLQFVTPQLIAGLGAEVYTSLIDLTRPDQAMLHIGLAKWADLIMLAPASANTIAKAAAGIADELLFETLLVAGQKPRYIAPAMNYQMWVNSLTQHNIQKLEQHGFHICWPASGSQACGDNGEGRMLEAEQLSEIIEGALTSTTKPFSGKTILLTLGATIEQLDPVRYISNHSSGKMGLALIKEALKSDANVIALCGKTNINLPVNPQLRIINTLTASEMLAATLKYAHEADMLIACAAVCDYRPAAVAQHKIKKDDQLLNLKLIKNPDILQECKSRFPNLFCIGFAAETENLIENAINKLKRKNLDLIVANNVKSGAIFNQDMTQISLIDRNLHITTLNSQTKLEAAKSILDLAARLFNDSN